ncbi:hypothetical protein KP803_17175 [Vibrio sp. ZSDE26]|uniref:Uncharacterized protein n=1 Tax=Vibrio amylolyticus TaxID=2847292 RepID=A0A9X2BMK0_9VIBR|nr:hypothetical protein [Vibrio amylolyticus]MCK6265013.1 hypothetical protein [Vibrio amylolyticus]
MRCKSIFFLTSLLFTSSAVSQTWTNYLEQEMVENYEVLNSKVRECKQLRKEFDYSIEVKNEWFLSLTVAQKQNVVMFAFSHASNKCIQHERASYTDAMLNYVAETGDTSSYDQWLLLAKEDKDIVKVVEELGVEKVIKLVNEYFESPFDALKVIRALNLY